MEYLVAMTTQVPEGTPAEAVEDIRAREAAHSRELAAQGHLLRLWRPPLQPGEWRTLGLFAADDGGQLEEVLASMPLRVWRTDEVTPLSPHPNDPARQSTSPGSRASKARDEAVEFLTAFTLTVPAGTSAQAIDDAEAREAQRAKELAGQGHLRPGARAGPVAGAGRGRDAGDHGVTAAVCLDERADHAAHPTPQRPGALRPEY